MQVTNPELQPGPSLQSHTHPSPVPSVTCSRPGETPRVATAQIPENLPRAIFGWVLCHWSFHRTTVNPVVTLSPPFANPFASFLACMAHVGLLPLVELACALALTSLPHAKLSPRTASSHGPWGPCDQLCPKAQGSLAGFPPSSPQAYC